MTGKPLVQTTFLPVAKPAKPGKPRDSESNDANTRINSAARVAVGATPFVPKLCLLPQSPFARPGTPGTRHQPAGEPQWRAERRHPAGLSNRYSEQPHYTQDRSQAQNETVLALHREGSVPGKDSRRPRQFLGCEDQPAALVGESGPRQLRLQAIAARQQGRPNISQRENSGAWPCGTRATRHPGIAARSDNGRDRRRTVRYRGQEQQRDGYQGRQGIWSNVQQEIVWRRI